jgi:hypothetical protein
MPKNCDGGPDSDGHIGRKAHLGEPGGPFPSSQEEEPADDIESPDGAPFVDKDSAFPYGNANAPTEEEARKHLRHTEENHQCGNDRDSPRPTLSSRFHPSRAPGSCKRSLGSTQTQGHSSPGRRESPWGWLQPMPSAPRRELARVIPLVTDQRLQVVTHGWLGLGKAGVWSCPGQLHWRQPTDDIQPVGAGLRQSVHQRGLGIVVTGGGRRRGSWTVPTQQGREVI